MNGKATISIGGVKTPLFFGYTCFKNFTVLCAKFKDSHLIDDEEGETTLTTEGMARLFFSAYQNERLNTGRDMTLTFDDFCRYIDDSFQTEEGKKEITDTLSIWAESSEMKKLSEKKSEEKPPEQSPSL